MANKDMLRARARQLAGQGASAASITRTLKEEFGSAYRRTELLADMRSWKGQAEPTAERRYRATPKKFRPREFNFADNDRRLWDWQKKYNHLLHYELYNRSTKQRQVLPIMVTTDSNNYSVSQIEKMARQKILEGLEAEQRGEGSPTLAAATAKHGSDRWQLVSRSVRIADPVYYEETVVRRD